MKLIHTLMLAASCSASTALAAPLEPINLWPEGVPGEAKPLAEPESVDLKGDYQIEIMSNVSIPQLTMYPAENPNGTAVIVCPGGGYNILAYSHEGTEVCEWLNSIGITAGLLKYRVPRRDQLAKHEAPLQDVQRAIGMMRARADEWKIKSDKIGVLGFSAGGHLSSMALTSDGTRTYKPDPKFDSGSCIPNFGVLVYPAYQLDEKNPDKLSPEIKVTDKTPPAFLVVAHGDKQWAEGSARFYIEMKRADRDCELHIFGKGGHGFGFANTDEEIKQWPTLAAKWMKAMKLVE
ncbi:alpha/beta hydrolase [Verrucomicrobiales bacterium BCK34]|nr:alpha/beta hydrolase [Verrucomicrobiales bacterium BCK34]